MDLLKRIDRALTESGKTRAELARELGISTQAITSLGKRPNATMKHENLEKAAVVLGCDLHWLKTGKGSHKNGMPLPTLVHTNYDHATEAALAKEYRASMVAWMFNDLATDEEKDDVINYIASKLAHTKRVRA